MLKKLVKQNRVSFFYEKFETWEGAVAAACQPLLMDKTITCEYIDAIIKGVKVHGPYIVIAPNICIPHAQEGGVGVNETAVAFMKVNEPVRFSDDSDQDARLFFVLASTDNDAHLQNLQELVEVISDESNVEKMLVAKCPEDLLKI